VEIELSATEVIRAEFATSAVALILSGRCRATLVSGARADVAGRHILVRGD
jgi:hypothetical protein